MSNPADAWQLLQDVIPNDHARQVDSTYYVPLALTSLDANPVVVDLGCGTGRSAAVFAGCRPDVRWLGIDVASSPESQQDRVTDRPVLHYDGVRLPLATAAVDVVYSHQVLEHVRYPGWLLAEVHRVLRPGGTLIGSTSQLEPYHSLSLWNYTPYGFRQLVDTAGLRLEEIRPGIDGVTLTQRAYKGRPPEWSRWFVEESPLNAEIDAWGAETGRRPALVNLRKLSVCGQFAFLVRRP